MLQRNTRGTIYVITFIIFLSNQISAQNNESVTYTSEEVADLKKYDYFNIDQFTQRTLFKVNLANSRLFGNNNGWVRDISMEQKLRPWLSIDAIGTHVRYEDNTHDSWIGGGVRFYPSKRENSRSKKDRINNFTGNYLRLGYLKDLSRNYNLYSFDKISFNVGRQKKISRFGYLDIGAEVNWRIDEKTLNLLANISAGIGYGPSSFENEINNTGTKSEFWNRMQLQLGSRGLIFGPSQKFAHTSLSAEILLGSYITIKPTINGGISHYRSLIISPEEEFTAITYGGSVNLEVRKYFGIQKRLARGKSVRAFSGTYAGIEFSSLINVFRTGGDLGNQNRDRFYAVPRIKIGWQERVSDRIIFDINYAIGYSYEQFTSGTSTTLGFLLVK